jgi:hypothetical protein
MTMICYRCGIVKEDCRVGPNHCKVELGIFFTRIPAATVPMVSSG